MVRFRSCLLTAVSALMLLGPVASHARRFYPDDPIREVPRPLPVGDIHKNGIYAAYDYFYQSGRQKRRASVPALGINTLGEVPDSAWFTNRHGRVRMTLRELQRGPGDENPPIPPFRVVGAKSEGITPGFRMRDAAGRLYFVKTDPAAHPGLTTGAEILGARFFHAIGYNTPENYIVTIRRPDCSVDQNASIGLGDGLTRRMSDRDLDELLARAAQEADGSVRAVASLEIPGKGLGPFRYEGTRSDDPNDLVPHQDRRDLRGLFVFCAWLNHTDAKGANSYDALIRENGIPFVRHYLIDFGSAFGSDGDIPKDARLGHEYQIPSAGKVLRQLLGFGLFPAEWERARYPALESLGRFESGLFDPGTWKTNYPNPAFLSRLPDDEYWGAKIVLAFTDEDIRALVATGRYRDPRTAGHIARTLAERRDRIGRSFLSGVLPLENFRIRDGELCFDDLAIRYGYRPNREYRISWFAFDNEADTLQPLPEAGSFRLSTVFDSVAEGEYLAARIHDGENARKAVTVYLRKRGSTAEVAGLEREW